MAVKAGKIILPAGSSIGNPAVGWYVTGIGFKPSAVFFLCANLTTEDSWVTNSNSTIQGNFGIAVEQNSVSNTTIVCSMTGQIWQGGNVSNTSNQSLVAWVRQGYSTASGYAFSVQEFTSDGFRLRYANTGTFYDGNETGKIVYYLAISGSDKKLASAFNQNIPENKTFTQALGWEPKGLVAVGGTMAAYVGNAYDSYVFQAFINGLSSGHNISKAFGIRGHVTGGALDVSFWDERRFSAVPPDPSYSNLYGFESLAFVQPYAELKANYSKTSTNLTIVTAYESGFGGFYDEAYINSIVLGDTDIVHGVFTPDTNLNIPHNILTGITPEAFIFVSGPTGVPRLVTHGSDSDYVYYGHTTIGFLTSDFQCAITWGGCLLEPAAVFQSSTKSWISNYADTLPIGQYPTLGTAQLTATGFTHTTTQHSAASPHRVLYWGFGQKYAQRLINLSKIKYRAY